MVSIDSIKQTHRQTYAQGEKTKAVGNSSFGANLKRAAAEAAGESGAAEESKQPEKTAFYITVNGKTSFLDQNALISTCHASTGESANVYRAEGYTDENPLYLVKGTDQNGNPYEVKVDVRTVNPSNCSYIELLALSAHAGRCDFMTTAILQDQAKTSSYREAADYLSAARDRMDDLKLLKQWDSYLEYKGWVTDVLNFLHRM